MHEINRGLIVVRPKQPFLDWIRSVDEAPENLKLEDAQDDCTTYLVPELSSPNDEQAVIAWCWDVVFEQELFSWFTDENLWPTVRTQEMFMEWFDIEFHNLVFDLIDDLPLEHIEYDNADATSSNGDPSSNGH
jgi:hypothetical protein